MGTIMYSYRRTRLARQVDPAVLNLKPSSWWKTETRDLMLVLPADTNWLYLPRLLRETPPHTPCFK